MYTFDLRFLFTMLYINVYEYVKAVFTFLFKKKKHPSIYIEQVNWMEWNIHEQFCLAQTESSCLNDIQCVFQMISEQKKVSWYGRRWFIKDWHWYGMKLLFLRIKNVASQRYDYFFVHNIADSIIYKKKVYINMSWLYFISFIRFDDSIGIFYKESYSSRNICFQFKLRFSVNDTMEI